ncbi:hypothetical protein [Streptomyces sp. NPDC059009]|uniref:hypothetical protein n=1 Tax=Streptomyces sp. NPDC059009 TaxID=3346694 RepID=UPI00367E91C9
MAPAKAGAASVETLRLRVRAREWAARRHGRGGFWLLQADGVQLVDSGVATAPDPEAVRLGPDDVPEMLNLVARTRPGPFLESEGGGLPHPGLDQGALVGFRCLQDAGSARGGRPVDAVRRSGGPHHGGLHPAEQGRGPGPGRRPAAGTVGRTDGGHDGRDPLAVHGAQLRGEPLGKRVVTAHDHVALGQRVLGLLGQ